MIKFIFWKDIKELLKKDKDLFRIILGPTLTSYLKYTLIIKTIK